jgi:hypothetical protein
MWTKDAFEDEGNDPLYRELFVKKSDRLLYRIADKHVLVVGFVHAARDLSALWERYKSRPSS